MIKSWFLRKKIVKIIEDRFFNWREKSGQIEKLYDEESNVNEVIIQIISSHKDEKVRKGLASVVGYLDKKSLAEKLLPLLFEEEDWSVRYAIANSCGHILRKQALKQLDELLTKNLQGTQNRNKQYEFKKKYVEALGTIAIPESLDILVKMLGKEYQKYGNDAKDLIVQIIYSMGELGTIKAIAPLQQITLEHSPYSQSMKNSAHHALEKIAKNNGYSSKRQMLEKISQE